MNKSEFLRLKRQQDSPFAPLYDAARERDAQFAAEGRRPVLGGLLSKEPVAGADTIEYEGIKSMLLGLLSPAANALDAPMAAYQGSIPMEDMSGEAMNLGGMVMGGGAAASGRGILDNDPTVTRIFAGRRAAARTNDSRRSAMSEAEKLFEQGVSNRGVYDKAEVFKGADGKMRFEIDDSASTVSDSVLPNTSARLEDYLQHPELFELYPTMRGMQVDFKDQSDMIGVNGSFSPADQRIRLAVRPTEDMRSTLLHEVQHSVQDREGFSGGSTTANDYSLEQAKGFAGNILSSPEAKNMQYQSQSFNQQYNLARPLYRAEYIDKLDNIISKSNEGRSKPSDISRLSDWYKYSGKIRSDIGAMPNRAGPSRDEWIASAARKIKNYTIEDMSDAQRSQYQEVIRSFDTPNDRKNAIRRIENKIEKHRDGHFGWMDLIKRAENAQGLNVVDAYLREAGEVEARNVQTRLQRGIDGRDINNVPSSPAYNGIFPIDTADFPLNEQVVSSLKAGQPLPNVASRNAFDPKLAASLRRGLLN